LETEILPVIDDIINHDPTEQTPFQFFHQWQTSTLTQNQRSEP
jgi:hypothetical protein